jgi:hypothetical protein
LIEYGGSGMREQSNHEQSNHEQSNHEQSNHSGGGDSREERWDGELAALARAGAALRLRLGQVLELSSQKAHVFTLGFSSVSAYALERCERSSRWVEGARCLARRLEGLPALRRALAYGELSWSAAELVARVAEPAEEQRWLAAARTHTVRQLRLLVREAVQQLSQQHSGKEEGVGALSQPSADPEESEGEELCTLTCTVDREDAWLFEATRRLLEQVGAHGATAQLEALLAEGQEVLLAALPRGSIDPDALELSAAAQQRWREQLQRWQAEAEERCEKSLRTLHEPSPSASACSIAAAAGCSSLEGATASDLDAQVRGLSLLLARQELVLSRALLSFHRADGWRRLGYATESQYARERLGLSRSSLLARRGLAARLEALPAVALALGAGQIGVEAALQVVRIATPRTERAWLERAERRTIKHLREEVSAALMAVRFSGELDCPPPQEAELDAYAELERAVVSGRACKGRAESAERLSFLEACGSVDRRAWQEMLGSLHGWLKSGVAGPVRMSAARLRSSAGRVEVRLQVPRHLFSWWRGLEAQARRHLPPGMSWLKFLCLSVWSAWQHLLGAEVAYGAIYLRDVYRCRSPVCSRRDVTPHHLRFRSQGGGEEAENLASVCTWCHLLGIHGGRIRAHGAAESIHWELGPLGHPCLVVHGRERQAA